MSCIYIIPVLIKQLMSSTMFDKKYQEFVSDITPSFS